MLLRDRLQQRLDEMGSAPDYVRIAEEVLGLRHVPPALARRLVLQGLVIDDRQETWRAAGARICRAAPERPGVYVLRDDTLKTVYVGKAVNLRRRLRAHFAQARWRRLSPEMARVVDAEWQEVGSELESLLLEAEWIGRLAPSGNTQIGLPVLDTRAIPATLLKDTIVLLRSVEPDAVELVAASPAGPVMRQRARRNGDALAVHVKALWAFFTRPDSPWQAPAPLAPLVFSWLTTRGSEATRIEMERVTSATDLHARLEIAFRHRELFSERIVVL